MIYDVNGHTPKMDPDSWVASNAVLIGRVELKKNSNIWFNATLRGDLEPIIIGEGSNIQDGSVIHRPRMSNYYRQRSYGRSYGHASRM